MGAAPRYATGLSRTALRFFLQALLVVGGAALLTRLLIAGFGRSSAGRWLPIPWPFLLSTVCLGSGSLMLHRAVRAVRREKQQVFRRQLFGARVCAALFLGIQSYGLWSLFPPERAAEDASLGTTAFALALATLHALHFLVAVLFVVFVTARTREDRYDHEYYWGVLVCSWFWHVLGIVWIAILAVFLIVL